MSGLRPWWLRTVSNIDRYEMLADRLVERGADHDMDVVDGLGCETGAMAPAGGEEVGVEAVEVFGMQRSQRHRSEYRGDVVVDHPLVPVRGRCL